jgi:hypothetical protein
MQKLSKIKALMHHQSINVSESHHFNGTRAAPAPSIRGPTLMFSPAIGEHVVNPLTS